MPSCWRRNGLYADMWRRQQEAAAEAERQVERQAGAAVVPRRRASACRRVARAPPVPGARSCRSSPPAPPSACRPASRMPLVPLALERQGADKLTIGIVSAAWGIGMLAIGSRIPRLAARFGAVPFIVASVVAGSRCITVAYTLTDRPGRVVRADLPAWRGRRRAVGGERDLDERRRRGEAGAAASWASMPRWWRSAWRWGRSCCRSSASMGRRRSSTCAGLALLVALPLLPYWKHGAARSSTTPTAATWQVVVAGAARHAGRASPAGLGEQVAFSFLPVYAVGAGVSAETGALWLSAFVIGNVDRCNGRSAGWPTISTGAPCWPAARSPARCWCSAAAGCLGAVAGDHRRDRAVGRHLVRDLSGRPGAARPALQAAATSPAPTPPSACSTSWAAWSAGRSPARRWMRSAIPASAGRWRCSMRSPALAALLAFRRRRLISRCRGQ